MATEVERARRLFTVEEYDRMVEVGILGENDRVELIEGEIVEMSPIGYRHGACVANLTRIFNRRLDDRAVVWSQSAVTVSARSKPEPDVGLLRPRSYFDGHPGIGDIFLLIEVAESSLAYDRTVKLGLYAAAGVPEYWVVDAESCTVETFRTPIGGGYRDSRRYSRDELIAPGAFPDVAFRVAEVFA
jgi:Uma2 family endonuclease